MTKAQALAAVLLFPLAAHAAPRLRSPWDGKDVRLTGVPYVCPALQRLSPDLTTDRFYSDSKSSVIDPEKWKAYVASSGPSKNLGQQIVDAADAYRATGSREAAECAIRHAEAAATDGVFTGQMSSNQAYYVQGWVIGAIAIAYLKVRGSGLVRRGQQHVILPWIVSVVQQTENYYDTRRQKETGDSENNHLYWAGVEISAAGIAANDRQLFNWGMDAYRAGVARIGLNPIQVFKNIYFMRYGHIKSAKIGVFMQQSRQIFNMLKWKKVVLGIFDMFRFKFCSEIFF